MHILLYSLNYAPELVGIGKYNSEFANWLTKQGHEVRVICSPPYYPAWRITQGYKAWSYRKELCQNNISIYRCPTWVPAQPTGAKRIIHLLSFTISSLPILIWQVFTRKVDIIFVLEPPFFCLPSALIVAKLAFSKVWLHIQDFEIDAGFSLKLVPNISILRKTIFLVETFLMNQTDAISTISLKMLNLLIQKKIASERCFLFPNWVDTQKIYPIDSSRSVNPFCEKLEISASQIVCLYSGNIGKKQNLDQIIEVARTLQKYSNIVFVIAGEGSEKESITKKSKELQNIYLLPLQPLKVFNDLLNFADIHLLPQSAEAADLVMPSKLQAIFASGRPVVTTSEIGTQLALIVEGRGIVVPPDNNLLMSQAILELSQNPEKRHKLGQSARDYAIKYWDRENVMINIEDYFVKLTTNKLTTA